MKVKCSFSWDALIIFAEKCKLKIIYDSENEIIGVSKSGVCGDVIFSSVKRREGEAALHFYPFMELMKECFEMENYDVTQEGRFCFFWVTTGLRDSERVSICSFSLDESGEVMNSTGSGFPFSI